MGEGEAIEGPAAELVDRLAAIGDAGERRELLRSDAADLGPGVVEALCRRAAEVTPVEPVRAAEIAATARAISERLADDRSLGLSHRAAANALLYQRDYQAAQHSYELALERFEAAGDEVGAAVTRSIGLHSLSHLGDPDRALAWASRARATLTEKGERLRLARLEQNLATVLSRSDRFNEALQHFRSAYEIFVEQGEPRDVGATLRNLAVCYQDLNDFRRSLAAYEQARGYCREHGLTVHALEVDYNIAYLFFLRGQYAEALRRFEETRRSCERHDDPHHAALCDLDQAEIYLELNLVREAAHLSASAHEGFRRLGMTYEMAKALAYGGIAAARLGEGEEAEDLLQMAHETFEEQGNGVWLAMIDLYRARIERAGGRRERALALARQAHAALAGAAAPQRAATSRILLARLTLESGDHEEAARLAREALAEVAALGMPALEFQAHLLAGQIEESSGRRPEALAAYRRSLEALERLRGALLHDDLRIAFAAGKDALFAALVRLTLDDDAPDRHATAFALIEKAKSRGLADLLAMAPRSPAPRAPRAPELAASVRELREEVNWLYRRIDGAELDAGEAARRRLSELRSEARRRERRLLREQRRLVSLDPELAAREGSEEVDLETLRAALPPDSALLEYFLTAEKTYLCLLDRERIEIFELPPAIDLDKTLRGLSFQLGKHAMGPERVGNHVETSTRHYLGQLYDALIAPVRSHLAGRRLILSPHGDLHRVPFPALFDGERFLIDDFEISYSPSATVFHLCAARRNRPEASELVLGVSDERAPKILDEVEAVADTLPNARLLTGEEASRERLERLARRSRIVHLATHGHFRGDNPMFSALQLADSRLSLFDLYDMRLEADLVVLSGCGTGLAAVSAGDELIGLTRGVLYAGSRAVLATLWDVHDETTREFMVSFYRLLATAPRTADAVRRAQLEIRERHPQAYYWAPFLLVGWPGPLGDRRAAASPHGKIGRQ